MCKYTFSLIFLSLLIGLSSCKKPIDQKDAAAQKNWEIGPFVKQDAENPILVPNSKLVFIDPVSGEETACAMRKEREFRRLRHIDLDSYNFTTVLVDPPRAGLDEKTLQFIAQFQTIIYISCNPTTLANNLTSLTLTHCIDKFAAFDQFPYSEHCECGVILNRTE